MLKPACAPALAIDKRRKLILPPGLPCPKVTAVIAPDAVLLDLLESADVDLKHGQHPTEQIRSYFRYCSTVYFLEARRRGIIHTVAGIEARGYSRYP